MVLPGGDEIEYLVDREGRRVGKNVNGVFEKGWLWRGQLQPVAEVDAGGGVTARYVYAEGVNAPELMLTAGATYRLVKDHLGSLRQVVDVASGMVVQELVYDAWGRVLLDTNPGFQPFGFAGGLYERETGLVRFGARDYDAEVGRWTSKDRLGITAGGNLYAYVSADPVNGADSSGNRDDRKPLCEPLTCKDCEFCADSFFRFCNTVCDLDDPSRQCYDACRWEQEEYIKHCKKKLCKSNKQGRLTGPDGRGGPEQSCDSGDVE